MPADAMTQAHQPVQRSFSSDDITSASQGYSSPQMPPAAQHQQPYRSLRTRRAQQNLKLPLHLRRSNPMDNNSWIQSISDTEDGSHFGRNFLHGMPSVDRVPIGHENSYSTGSDASHVSHNIPMHGSAYNAARVPTTGSSSSYSSPLWPIEPHTLNFDGVSSAPISSVWPQSNHGSFLSDTSVSLPSTPAPVGLYQSQLQDRTSRQMPHLNTPPASAVSVAKLGSNGTAGRPHLKVDTGSHGYFKENGSIIINKWFNNTTTQIAPPEIYNVPPAASISSQDSCNDASSIASGKKLSMTPVHLHPARSDLSSQLSFTSAGDFASQSPRVGYSSRRRLPNNTSASASPTIARGLDAQDGSNYNSPGGATSVAASVYESDSNYAASSAQSSQPSRLPSPALSDSRKSAQNAFLIDARAKGMSYKEIKAKGGFTEAESTLRGRHRMLTKDKENRVRKPGWTETDVSPTKPKYPRNFTQNTPT